MQQYFECFRNTTSDTASTVISIFQYFVYIFYNGECNVRGDGIMFNSERRLGLSQQLIYVTNKVCCIIVIDISPPASGTICCIFDQPGVNRLPFSFTQRGIKTVY